MKKLLALLLLPLLLCSCIRTSPNETETVTKAESETAYQDTAVPETEEPTQTTSPVTVKMTFYIYDDEVAIGGTVQNNAVVTARSEGYEQTQTAQGETFFMSLPCGAEYTLTAKAQGFKESEPIKYYAEKNKGEELSNCYVGKNSQLFLKEHIKDYKGERLFSENDLNALNRLVKKNVEKLQSVTGKQTKLIYLVVPNPQSLYPEYAPESVGDMSETNRRTQFCKAVTGIENAVAVDLYDVLAAGKSEGYLIRQTDSHWTEYAGFLAFTALQTELLKDNPQMREYTLADFTQVTKQSIVGNYLKDKTSLYETEVYLHPNFEYKNPLYTLMAEDKIQDLHIRGEYEVNTGDKTLPTCQFVRDSFSTCIMKYIAEDFGYMYMQQMWVHKIDFDKAEDNKPDYVIHLLLENNLGELLAQ